MADRIMTHVTANQGFIQLQDITHAYREGEQSHSVLQDVFLSINQGEKVALLGRSGSGKSTLLNLISGIDIPDRGNIIVDGLDLTAMSEQQRTLFRRQHIGFVYQFFNLVPSLTARENIALVLELNQYDEKAIASRTGMILEATGLTGRADKFPSQLSGGEQQRVAIARALVHCPKVVLADEPTGNLDAATGNSMLDLLRELSGRHQSTLLLVTHSLAVAQIADRILTLEAGQVVERDGDFAW
ncbi:MAG: ABC transporter ATP-binding protein [Pseudohongiellaceae bacterium]